MEEEEATEIRYDQIRELERAKKDIAIPDFDRMRYNIDSVMKVLQVQLTKILMELTQLEKDIEGQVNQYWMKELPIQNSIVAYVKNVTLLINTYTQVEQTLTSAMEEIYGGIDFPDYVKMELSYKEQIKGMKERMDIMKEEVEKYKEDLLEEFQSRVKEEAQKERVKLHKEYEALMTEAELLVDEKDKEITILKEKVLKLSHLLSSSDLETKKKGSEIVDETIEIQESFGKKDDVVFSADSAKSGHYEVIEATEGRDSRREIPEPEDENALKKSIEKDLKKYLVNGKSFSEIRKELSKKHSPSSFYKYLYELEQDGVLKILREGHRIDGVAIISSEEGKDAKKKEK